MIFTIESIALCAIFTLAIMPALYKNPLSQIASYPTAIRKRVEALPEYKSTIKALERKHIARKIAAVILFAIIFAAIARLSGLKTFKKVFANTFMLFFVVNLYDLIVLDLIIFCRSKKIIIPGTEDMEKEYKDPKPHILGFAKGLLIGLAVSMIACGITVFLNAAAGTISNSP